jgi:zinc transport system substrate-binding protein
VASIKPIHSLVAAVMEGVGEPGLIIEGAGSPHTYALRPSQAQMLEQADIVFWVGHELEAFLEKPLETVGANAKSVELIDAHDLVKLGFREGGAFEKHSHGDEALAMTIMRIPLRRSTITITKRRPKPRTTMITKAAEAGHDHMKRPMAGMIMGMVETAEAGHDHGEFDAHVWLDPVNAKAMVHEIEEALVEADPDNAARYEANADAVSARLDALIADVSSELEPVKGKGFIVFHDGYQYFENRFGITASGSITVSPEVMPGAERITEIRERVQELGAACVFAEPQFEPKLVSTVIEGTNARSGTLDPLGAGLEDGAELYFQADPQHVDVDQDLPDRSQLTSDRRCRFRP